MSNNRFLLYISLLLLSIGWANAQDLEKLRRNLDAPLHELDFSKIPTGILAERAVELLPFDAYDGVLRDSNYSDYSSQAMLYLSLASSRDDMLKDMSPESYLSIMKKAPNESLSLLLFRYSTLREQAYQEGLIKRNGNSLSFMKPSSQRLYQQREVFSLAPKRVVWDTYDVSFVLPPNLIWCNMQEEIRDLRIRFEENAPFKVVKPSHPVSHHYQREGIHRIVFQIRLKDGRSLQSQTNIQIVLPKELKSGSSTTNYIHNEVPILSKRGVHKGGTLQICYADPMVRKLRKPLIIAEGFEVSNLGFHTNYDLNGFLDGTMKNESYSSNCFAGFDVVYLDYNCPTDDIWSNAELMRDAIRWVNEHKEGSTENIVMGYSMGGLVAAIALRQMELANEDHDTKKYISLDSPHCGATVPFAVFAAYDYFHPLVTQSHLYALIKSINPKIQTSVLNLQALREAPAVRQMVIAEGRDQDRRVYLDFQKKYRELGLPTKTINIAFSNSSQEAKYPKIEDNRLLDLQGKGHAGPLIPKALLDCILQDFSPPRHINIIPQTTDLSLDVKLRLINRSDPEFGCVCKVKRKALGFLPSDSPFDGFMWSVNYPYDEYGVSERSVCSTLGIKSNMNVNEKYLSRELSFGDGLLSGILNWFIGAVKYGVYITNSIGFIPRYSSLYTPLASDSKESPFDRFYCIQADTSAGHEYLNHYRSELQNELLEEDYHVEVEGSNVLNKEMIVKIKNPLANARYEFYAHPNLMTDQLDATSARVVSLVDPSNYQNIYLFKKVYVCAKSTREVNGHTIVDSVVHPIYNGSPHSDDFEIKQLSMTFKLSDNQCLRYAMPAVLVKWKGHGDILNAHWRYSDSKQPITTENRVGQSKDGVVNTSGNENKMLLVGAFEKDPKTGGVRKMNSWTGSLVGDDGLPYLPGGDDFEPDPPVAGPGYPPGWENVIKNVPGTPKVYLFVPALQYLSGWDQVKLELQLENEAGVGDWSKPFVLSLKKEGEDAGLKPIIIPSVFLEETSTIRWINHENEFVNHQDGGKYSWLDLEIEMFVKDPSGRLHHHAKVKTNQTIDLRFLAPGHYFVEFVCNGKRFMQHVIKQ